MREEAYVLEVKEGGKAVVEVKRTSACENCASKCLIGENNLNMKVEVDGAENLASGDRVFVELEFASVFTASAIAYGIPLLAFFGGIVLGSNFLAQFLPFTADTTAFFTGIAFTAVAFMILRIFSKKGAFDKKYKIRIARLVD